MKRIIKYLLLGFLVFLPYEVMALDTATITCDKSKIGVGEKTICKLTGNSDGSVSSLHGLIKLSEGLKLGSSDSASIWIGSAENGIIDLYTDVNKTGKFEIATFEVSATGSTKTGTVAVEELLYYGNHDKDNSEERAVSANTVELEVVSSNNSLKSLTLSSGTIDFSPTKLEYEVKVSKNIDKITIDATLDDSKAFLDGDVGTFPLKYGENEFSITVVSESNNPRVYKIVVIREDDRSNNGNLKELVFKDYNIILTKNKTEYELVIDKNIDKLILTSLKLEDEKAKVKEVKAAAPVTCKMDGSSYIFEKLQLGENFIQIEIEAENEMITTYMINVIRGTSSNAANNGNNNSTTVKVPDTGSSAIYIVPIIGLCLVAFGIFMVFYIKRRKKEDNINRVK